jgi:hypothetical protein
MTPTPDEHLELIAARCRELLEDMQYYTINPDISAAIAGWRTTLAAIEGLRLIAEHGQEPARGSCRFELGEIRAAWPVEMLTKTTP